MNATVAPSVLVSIFRRNGDGGIDTKLFADLEETKRLAILDAVSLVEEEEAVAAHFASEYHWCLVTNKRVHWLTEGTFQQVTNDDIIDATIDRDAAQERKVVDASELQDLKLVLRDGSTYTIALEPGAPFSAIWNTLKFFARRQSE